MQPEQQPNYFQQGQPEQTSYPADVVPAPPDDQFAAEDALSWQASEYVHHEKGVEWFLALIGVATALLLLDIVLIRSWTFGILIVVMAMAAIVVARRPPHVISYLLSSEGIQIDEKHFGFHDFRAFGVIQEGAFYSIRLIPVKRFMPMVSVYFPTEMGEQIVDVFGSMLPMEQIKLDPIDKFVEKIRF
jgi:hypothetical protein